MAPAHPPASTTNATTPGGAASRAMSTAMRAARLAWINVVADEQCLARPAVGEDTAEGREEGDRHEAAAAITPFQEAWWVTSAT